jgi:hypothetical protein
MCCAPRLVSTWYCGEFGDRTKHVSGLFTLSLIVMYSWAIPVSVVVLRLAWVKLAVNWVVLAETTVRVWPFRKLHPPVNPKTLVLPPTAPVVLSQWLLVTNVATLDDMAHDVMLTPEVEQFESRQLFKVTSTPLLAPSL